MDAVEKLVAQTQGWSGSAADVSQLHHFLKLSEDVLRANAAVLSPFFDQLDPSTHSLGYLYLLDAYTSSPISRDQASEIVSLVARFINSCLAEQIRLAHDKFVFLCRRYRDQVMALEAPIRAVAPMLTAIRKIQPSSEHLTTLHPDFLLLCVLAKCYKTGFSVIEDDVFEVDQPKDLFLYCYYGGMICIGLKKYERALELLHNVVTSPMITLNAIAVEAYKKYILVSLIHSGQFSTHFPKYTSSVAQRSLKNFTQDNNMGLVKQVLSSMYKRNIQRLTQTYLTLSLDDIANTVQLFNPKEAEMHVLQMIEDGQIYATINQKDGMVRFLEDPEQYKTCEMIERIDCSVQRIMALSKKLTAVDEHLSCDPLYLAKIGKERQRFEFDDFDGVSQKFNI